MGSCTGKLCTTDDQAIIVKVQRTEIITLTHKDIQHLTHDQLKQIVYLQAFVRGYIVRKSASTHFRPSGSSVWKQQSDRSEYVTKKTRKSKIQSLLIEQKNKLKVTYISSDQQKMSSEMRSKDFPQQESNLDDPMNKQIFNIKLEKKAFLSSEIFEVSSQKSIENPNSNMAFREFPNQTNPSITQNLSKFSKRENYSQNELQLSSNDIIMNEKFSHTLQDKKSQNDNKSMKSLNERKVIFDQQNFHQVQDINSNKMIESNSDSDNEVDHQSIISRVISSNRMNRKLQVVCFDPLHQIDTKLINAKVRVSLPLIVMSNGGEYQGSWENGQGNGQGKYIFTDKSVLTATWINNQAQGLGTFTHPDGDLFKGNWRNGQADGYGFYLYPNGGSYAGLWRNDYPHGNGKEIQFEGNQYEGQFKKGFKHGYGEMKFSDGSIYKGQFVKNEMEGKGVYNWSDGRKYEGDWKQSKKEGKGFISWPDGRTYDGQYLNDKKCGFGTYKWTDGRKYVGQWFDGLQHGIGEFLNSDGISSSGKWINGKFQKK